MENSALDAIGEVQDKSMSGDWKELASEKSLFCIVCPV